MPDIVVLIWGSVASIGMIGAVISIIRDNLNQQEAQDVRNRDV